MNKTQLAIMAAVSTLILAATIHQAMAWDNNNTPPDYDNILWQRYWGRAPASTLTQSNFTIYGSVQYDFQLGYPKTLLIHNQTKVNQFKTVHGTITLLPTMRSNQTTLSPAMRLVQTKNHKTDQFNKVCKFNVITYKKECK